MNKHVTFEKLFQQNERRFRYHLHQRHLHDPLQHDVRVGFIPIWHVYCPFHPDTGILATYFNFMIRDDVSHKVKLHSVETFEELRCSGASLTTRRGVLIPPSSHSDY